MPQLQRGRWFQPHCPPALLLTVTIDISTNKCSFAPFCNDSDPRCANLHSASKGAPSSPLKLGVLPQYHPEPMPAIDSLDQGNSTSKRFRRAFDHLQFLDFPASNQEIFVWLNHPNHSIELRPSHAASQLIAAL